MSLNKSFYDRFRASSATRVAGQTGGDTLHRAGDVLCEGRHYPWPSSFRVLGRRATAFLR